MAKENTDWLIDFAIKEADKSSRALIESSCLAVNDGYNLDTSDEIAQNDVRQAAVYLIRRALNLDSDIPRLPFHLSVHGGIITFQDRDK